MHVYVLIGRYVMLGIVQYDFIEIRMNRIVLYIYRQKRGPDSDPKNRIYREPMKVGKREVL